MLTSFASNQTTITKCYAWIKLSCIPFKTFYCQEIEQNLRSDLG